MECGVGVTTNKLPSDFKWLKVSQLDHRNHVVARLCQQRLIMGVANRCDNRFCRYDAMSIIQKTKLTSEVALAWTLL